MGARCLNSSKLQLKEWCDQLRPANRNLFSEREYYDRNLRGVALVELASASDL